MADSERGTTTNQLVSRLIEEIGFAPVDAGSLRDGGRVQQPRPRIYPHPMTGWEAWAALSHPGKDR